ncbi:hypothetical protein [Verrucomicrobium spinosum]|uniref:hypothetical protein n=1 Tax=Verrucomicrobium spinosum TaxID=2736 RepID=UPI0018DCE56C|nr:hypothetical protein [Verrucomicrobium spinosum]
MEVGVVARYRVKRDDGVVVDLVAGTEIDQGAPVTPHVGVSDLEIALDCINTIRLLQDQGRGAAVVHPTTVNRCQTIIGIRGRSCEGHAAVAHNVHFVAIASDGPANIQTNTIRPHIGVDVEIAGQRDWCADDIGLGAIGFAQQCVAIRAVVEYQTSSAASGDGEDVRRSRVPNEEHSNRPRTVQIDGRGGGDVGGDVGNHPGCIGHGGWIPVYCGIPGRSPGDGNKIINRLSLKS